MFIYNFFKNLSSEKKYFYIFLLIHFIVWSTIGLIRTVLPTDSLEGIYWGSLLDFGTPKHPPMSGWLTYFTYLPFKSDYSIYALSQAFIIVGLIYIYKLAKFFLDDLQAMLSAVIMEGCWVYSYITGYYGFNPDVILLGLLPVITYYFYKCMTQNDGKNWIILGTLVGLSFLTKYQTGILVISMALYSLIFNRQTFKNKFFYLSIFIAFLIFLPHLLWLIKYDFFPFMYFEGELVSKVFYEQIGAIGLFILMQIALIAGVIAIFALTKFVHKSGFEFIKERNKDFWFLIILGLLPNFIHLIMGAFEGGNMRPRWGFEYWYLTGIILFYVFPIKITKKEFVFTIKTAYAAMLIIFISLGTLLAVEKNYRSRYPVSTIYNDMLSAWNEKTDRPLKYIGGYIEWTLPLTIYGQTHPDCILDTFGYKNPWIDSDDLNKSGILIIGRTKKEIAYYAKKSSSELTNINDNDIQGYSFIVTNAFNIPRRYDIYYYIALPKSK